MLIKILCFVIFVSACYSQEDITKGPPKADKPSVPGWGFWPEVPENWKKEHLRLAQQSKDNKTDINIVFLGDSITQGWSVAGKEAWDKYFAKRGAFNYGIGGDSTRQVLWRIQNGELDGINPRVLVLMIGTNNLYTDYNNGTDVEVSDAIKLIVQRLRAKLPHTKILLLGLLPRDSQWLTDRCQEINRNIQYVHDNDWVFVLDLFHEFEETPGFVKKSLYQTDELELNAAGYEHMAKLMEPLLSQLFDTREEGDITHNKPAKDKPWVPTWGWWGNNIAWKFTHEGLLHQSVEHKTDIKAIFLGDEITVDWLHIGKEIWDEHYANRSVYNYGIGSDSTRQILYRIEKGEFDGLHPKVIVLNVGTNNLYDDFNGGTDEEIAKAIEVTVEALHTKLPNTNILLLGILPRDPGLSVRAQNINKLIAKLDELKHIFYLDMSPEFQESVGQVKSDLYQTDSVHLNKNGYQVWQKTMETLFTKLLG